MRENLLHKTIIRILLMVSVSIAFIVGPFPPSGEAQSPGEFVPGELLVKFQPGTSLADVDRALSAVGARIFGTFPLDLQLFQVKLPDGADLDQISRVFQASPSVKYVEKNWIVRAIKTPNDPRYSEQWSLNNTGQTGGTPGADIKAQTAWDLQTGRFEVVLASIDTGVDYTHPDLCLNIWTNPGEVGLDANGKDKSTNGIDDDGNGYIDDVRGWNFVFNTNDPLDDNDHGSHTSGTMGAATNNARGVAGVNWDVQIMPLKFLNFFGSGTTADAIRAIDYATDAKNRGTAPNLIASNNSWGGGGFEQALKDAIERANQAGILFVAAAGNSNSDNDGPNPLYPCSYDNANIICVAATDANDQKASFSSYGKTTVDLGAPGVSILSTTTNNNYQLFSGTSMATPHVTGTVGLVKSHNLGAVPALTHLQIKDKILNNVDPKQSMSGITVTGGRLNAFNAVSATTPGPPPPTNIPPTANPGGPYEGHARRTLQFDGSGSSDSDGKVLLYCWDFGDGTSFGVGPKPQHTYFAGGTYTVTLTVRDNLGATNTKTTTATIKGRRP